MYKKIIAILVIISVSLLLLYVYYGGDEESKNIKPLVEITYPSDEATISKILTISGTASDPDGHNLTYSASNLPLGASFDTLTQIFTWTPDYTQAGSYPSVTFTVTDDGTPVLNDSEAITITVNDINRAPVLDPVGDKSVDEGGLLPYIGKYGGFEGQTSR